VRESAAGGSRAQAERAAGGEGAKSGVEQKDLQVRLVEADAERGAGIES
jgi:hypothetical protein